MKLFGTTLLALFITASFSTANSSVTVDLNNLEQALVNLDLSGLSSSDLRTVKSVLTKAETKLNKNRSKLDPEHKLNPDELQAELDAVKQTKLGAVINLQTVNFRDFEDFQADSQHAEGQRVLENFKSFDTARATETYKKLAEQQDAEFQTSWLSACFNIGQDKNSYDPARRFKGSRAFKNLHCPDKSEDEILKQMQEADKWRARIDQNVFESGELPQNLWSKQEMVEELRSIDLHLRILKDRISNVDQELKRTEK